MHLLFWPWSTMLSLWSALDDDPPLLCGCDDGCTCDEVIAGASAFELV